MNHERIINCFRAKILNTQPLYSALTAKDISVPNVLFDGKGKSLWLELYIDSEEKRANTENETIYHCVVHQRVCVPINSGIKKAEENAALIYDLWSENDADRAGTVISANELLFIRERKLCSGFIDRNAFKVDVQITVDLFEKEI